MGSLTDFAEDAWLSHIFVHPSFVAPTNVYAALCASNPGEAASGAGMSELVNSNGYGRIEISFAAAGAVTNRQVDQSLQVSFPSAAGVWSQTTHYAIVDTDTYGQGSALAYGAFSSAFNAVSGNTVRLPSGTVTISVSATSGGKGFTDYAANGLLDFLFRNSAFPAASTYLALVSAAVSDAMSLCSDISNTEITGTGYARASVHSGAGASPVWDAPSAGVVSNDATVSFNQVGAGGWTSWNAVAVVTVSAGYTGFIIGYDNNLTDQATTSGDNAQFGAGSFTIQMT